MRVKARIPRNFDIILSNTELFCGYEAKCHLYWKSFASKVFVYGQVLLQLFEMSDTVTHRFFTACVILLQCSVMKAVLIFVLLALVAMVMGQSVNSTVPVTNSTVATRGPRGTPGVACKTRTTCGSCFELHTCTWSKTNQCVRRGSKREAALRKQDQIIDACPKTLFLGKTPIVLPDTPVVHEVVPAKMNNGPLDPFEIDVPVVATPDVFEALPIGSTVSRGPNFAFVEVDAEEAE